ncbi:MAG: tRNA lysidine(34) synthetase TilS [Bacteroidaceae bacterium]|nr:tRNA lysidine(34) synthetase TilS [Bacteroidaceae bacterium]
MIHKVAKFIEQKGLLAPGRKVLVALSGGADSVALLMVLKKLGYSCHAIHCNFHLRGEESMRDENFVRALCHRHNIPLLVTDFDTAGYAAEKGISIEMAARELRYDAFEKLRSETAAAAIAVAHHRDDSAETLLLNLLRGTGIKGLHGIQPKNGYIIRPLLCVGRKEITEYLEWRGEEYVTDSTNLETDFTRNKIRLEILPLMQQINPSAAESIAQTAERVSEAEKVYAKAISESIARVKQDNIIDVGKLKEEPSPQAVIYEILQPLAFNAAQIKDITEAINGDSGRTFSNGQWNVIKDRNTLIITPSDRSALQPTEISTDSEITTTQGILTCTLQPFDGNIIKEKNFATIDAAKAKQPLTLRHWQQGDRFTPFGMRGSKLLSDYMTDRKMSIIEKEQQLVVTDATGRIVWVVGERLAAQCATGNDTKEVIILQWNK